MSRVFGICKVGAVLAVIYALIYGLCSNLGFTAAVLGVITLYVVFGGYISLFREQAVRSDRLPVAPQTRMQVVTDQLIQNVRAGCGANIDGIKLYLVPESDEMNATAYGLNCVSVTARTLENTDLLTLEAVLAHEVSHILNCDAEFNRAVFCLVTLLMVLLSMVSFVTMLFVFVLFLVFTGFKSWLGVRAYQGTKKAVGGVFELLQRGVVFLYRTLLGLVSRHAEYRSDRFSCDLGFGLQLQYFLQITASAQPRLTSLTEVLYRSHPPTAKRLERLQRQLQESSPREGIGQYEGRKAFMN